jgi:hypothetical protein
VQIFSGIARNTAAPRLVSATGSLIATIMVSEKPQMTVCGSYLAWRARWKAQPLVRTYCQWVNEHIIPIAANFENQADAIEQETYEQLSALVDPETYGGDGSELHEQAFNTSLSLYETMVALYQATLNLFSAGLFHLIEQQLADLTHDASMETAVADTKLNVVAEYYRDHLKVDFTQFGSWNVIQELRVVANTTKHGEGPSAEELRKIRPELFQNPALRRDPILPIVHFRLQSPLGGDGLYVTPEDFSRYEKTANAIFDFVIEQFSKNGEAYFPR